jgi:hypothetical protein
MIGVRIGATTAFFRALPPQVPPGLGWTGPALNLRFVQGCWRPRFAPRDLVDPGIWTGPAIHVDGVAGADANSGLGAADGDFSVAKRTIFAAFTAGNATGAPYRVLIKPGTFENSAFTNNGTVEPNQHVAIIGWNGRAEYRSGPRTAVWTLDSGTTYSTPVTSLMRIFRADLRTPEGLYTELAQVADLATCRSTAGSCFKDTATCWVNIGRAPSTTDIVLIRSFHGARFMTSTRDIYLENIHCEGGISGALHCDPQANRNIVGVNCSFRYSAPSSTGAELDAVQIRRTNGLVAFFDSDASCGAKDGWNFHDDAWPVMLVLLVNCTGYRNGWRNATSCNDLTAHDGVILIALGGDYGLAGNGATVHFIENTRTWIVGARSTARDPDGTSTAFKCSNAGLMWLDGTRADAAGGAISNYGIEANGGQVFKRNHAALAGGELASVGGTISNY